MPRRARCWLRSPAARPARRAPGRAGPHARRGASAHGVPSPEAKAAPPEPSGGRCWRPRCASNQRWNSNRSWQRMPACLPIWTMASGPPRNLVERPTSPRRFPLGAVQTSKISCSELPLSHLPRILMRVGAIDIGSNSVRLLVADVRDVLPWGPGLETIARAGEPCRLGRGLHETGRVDDELVDRAGMLVAEFLRRARSLGARSIVAAATAALRRASNGASAAERISEVAGVPVRILSEADESRLVYRSVILGSGESVRGSQRVVFDLGGGSTEIVSGLGDRLGRWTSLAFGAVTLIERL